MPRPAAPQQSLDDIIKWSVEEVEGSLGSAVEDVPLWEPLPPEQGRPTITMPDGRKLSPQQAAVETEADELFYGGAGGSGKTDLLLGLATTRHKNSIIFRREFTQLRGAEGIIERSKQIVGERGSFNAGTYTWRDLPGHRALEFGAAKTDDDREKWRGRPHDFKGFDELPEFPESLFKFLTGWLRTTTIGQRTRIVGTGNPPTNAEGQWVIRYWAPWLDPTHPNPAQPGELRWFVAIDGKTIEVPGPDPVKDGMDRLVYPRSRTFIPGRVEDNPHYMRTGYDRVLDSLPEPLRSQLRFGSFTAVGDDDPWQVIPTAWVVAAQIRWKADPPCATSCVGVDPSRGGVDQFVIAFRSGNWIAPPVKYPASDAPDGVAGAKLIYRAVRGDTALPIQIDIIGTAGASVYDQCKQLKLNAFDMDGSRKAVRGVPGKKPEPTTDRSGKLRFANKRAEWHWRVRELLDPANEDKVALPPDPQLRADLCAPRWQPSPQGVRVERKEDIKARLGRSPDVGEAVIYALADEFTVPVKRKRKLIGW